MNEKHLMQLCLFLTIFSILLLALTYKPEFEEKTLGELIQKNGLKGKVFGRVEYVISNYPVTIFTLYDGNTATIYYPKATTLEKNNFVTTYLENQGQKNLFAQKVVKE